MGPEVVNKNRNCVFNGPYAGRDLYITMLEDTEREFVVTHNANIKPVSYFTGREIELQELRQRIEDGRKSVLVSGMGGIGKTQICRKLFNEYNVKNGKEKNGTFSHIGYIEYKGDMNSSLQTCLMFKKQDSPELNLEAAWCELEHLAADGKLLLFVDNVDKPVGEDFALQRLKEIPGAVILTSRQASICDEFETYPIGFLDVEQCKEIYEQIRFKGSGRKVRQEEEQDLKYVIENLAGRHTITVEHLAHLAWTKTWPVKKLREKLEEKGFCLEFHRDGKIVNIQKSYEALYDLSELTEAEQNILEAFSAFPYIPLAAGTCNEWLLADAGVSEEDDVLIGLYQKGWLQFDMGLESYTLHPVFSQFIYDKCKPTIANHYRLINSCRKSLEIPQTGSALQCQQYIPFAESIVEKIDMEKDLQIKFAYVLACVLQDTAEYKKAEKWFRIFSEIWQSELGSDHPNTVVGYNNLAYVYEKQGNYGKAKELYEKSLKINERELGENHPNTAISYSNLAGVYVEQGEYNKAKILHSKSLLIRKSRLGENHPDIANSYNNLAGVYARQGEYGKAEELYKKSLGINEKILGENNLDTVRVYINLAGVYESQGKYGKAKELYEKNLGISERILGEDHPDIARIYRMLARVYVDQGEYGNAEELYEKSLKIYERVLGENHPVTVDNYHDLAYLYVKQGEYGKARVLYEKSLEISKKVLGENHPDTSSDYHNLAGVYLRQGKYDKAQDLYEKSLKINKKVLGENHPNTLSSYHNLAGIYARQGKYNEAKKIYEENLKLRERVLGENHPDTAMSYNDLAYVHERQGEYGKAEELYKKSLKIRERVLGENHPDTAMSYNNLAGEYERRGEYDKAKELYEKSLRINEKVLGKDHPNTAISYNNLARIHMERGDYYKTLDYLLRGFKILLSKLGHKHCITQKCFKNLCKAYIKWNQEGNFYHWLDEKMKE